MKKNNKLEAKENNNKLEVKEYNTIVRKIQAIHYDGSKESAEACKKFIEGKYEIGIANTIRLLTDKGRVFILKGTVIVKDSSGTFKTYQKEEFKDMFELPSIDKED